MRSLIRIVTTSIRFSSTVAVVVLLITSALANAISLYNASAVLGQNNFTSNGSALSNTGSQGLSNPEDTAIDSVGHRLFVADTANNRVLVYALDSSDNLISSTASYVLGQANFTSTTGALSQSGMNSPTALAFDSANNRLFVLDSGNSRVLVFNTSSISSDMNASYVLGQSNFSGGGLSLAAGALDEALNFVTGIAYDPANEFLYIPDYQNNRVIVFNLSSGISSGMSPSYALGQSSLSGSSNATTQAGMYNPTAAAIDPFNNVLYVADSSNSRVLVYDLSSSISTGMPASYVLGQSSFTSSNTATSQDGLFYLSGLDYDSSHQRLFVADLENNRVLVFNTSSISTGMPASYVLGQSSFTVANYLTTQSGMKHPGGVNFDPTSSNLYVSDPNNNRITIFNLASGVSNGMNASYVLGQSVFTSSLVNYGGVTGMYGPNGSAVIDTADHLLFVTDSGHARVLVYRLDSSNNLISTTASYVLGQTDLWSSGAATTQSGMQEPLSLAYDPLNDSLFVGDEINARVLVYDLSSGITDGMNASYVLGEPNFTSISYVTSQSSIGVPGGLAFDSTNNRLFVADTDVGRVLVYDLSGGISNGMPATNVLGQPNFTSDACDITQSGMCNTGVSGLAFDNTNQRLFVSDGWNNSRVLVYDLSGGISNGMPASNVLGQPNFTSDSCNVSESGMCQNTGLGYDPTSQLLFVDDSYANHRVLVYNLASSITNGMPASGVLGQPNFTSSTNYGATQSTFVGGFSVNLGYDPTNNRLYLPDFTGNRVLVFDFAKITTSSLPNPQLDTAYTQPIDTTGTQGTVAYSLTSGVLPTGLKLDTSSGVISGTASTQGTYSFSIQVSDNNGNAGTYIDSASYSVSVPAPSLGGGSTITTSSGYNTFTKPSSDFPAESTNTQMATTAPASSQTTTAEPTITQSKSKTRVVASIAKPKKTSYELPVLLTVILVGLVGFFGLKLGLIAKLSSLFKPKP